MTSGASPENGRLFDWKRSGRYAWKAGYTLAPTGRPVKELSPPPNVGPGAAPLVEEPSSKPA